MNLVIVVPEIIWKTVTRLQRFKCKIVGHAGNDKLIIELNMDYKTLIMVSSVYYTMHRDTI